MRIVIPLLFFLFTSLVTLAQEIQTDSVRNRSEKADSLIHKPLNSLNQTKSNLNHRRDSLSSAYKDKLASVDSIKDNFQHSSDSLKQSLNSKLDVLGSVESKLQHKLDSAKTLNISTEKYVHSIDSVRQLGSKEVADANKKLEDIKGKTTGKLKSVELPPELQDKVSSVTKNVDGFKLPDNSNLNLSGMKLPGDLNLNGIKLPDNPIKDAGNMNLSSVDKLSGELKIPNKDIGGLPGEIKDVSKVTGEVGNYSKDAQSIANGNLGEVKEVPKALENKVGDLSGVDGLKNETKALDQYKDQLGKIQNPDAAKQEVVQQAQQQAINHFAGKEQVLQQAMEKLSKYKRKYSSISSLADLAKKPPNPMHGKPLIERLIPSLGLQFMQRGDFMIDFNPYLGYRLSGRLNAGAGWNERIAYLKRNHSFNSAHVYGPRVYGEFNLFKGFFPRLELEAMSTFVPPHVNKTSTSDPEHRAWVYSAFVGLKKRYQFWGHVNGTSSVMVNLYDPKKKSPYADLVVMRIGFEFPMKKKVKKAPSE